MLCIYDMYNVTDLLMKFQMVTVAAYIVKLCPLKEIKEMSQVCNNIVSGRTSLILCYNFAYTL